MADTRRSFFTAAFSWLSSLPLLSAWMAPVEASARAASMARISKEIDAAIEDHRKFVRKIRWIPVTERLPAMEPSPLRTINRSAPVLCCVAGECYPNTVRLIEGFGPKRWWIDGTQFYAENMIDISHWAELPGPPETEPSFVPSAGQCGVDLHEAAYDSPATEGQ